MFWVCLKINLPYPIEFCIVSPIYWKRPIVHQYVWAKNSYEMSNKSWERSNKLKEAATKFRESTNKPWQTVFCLDLEIVWARLAIYSPYSIDFCIVSPDLLESFHCTSTQMIQQFWEKLNKSRERFEKKNVKMWKQPNNLAQPCALKYKLQRHSPSALYNVPITVYLSGLTSWWGLFAPTNGCAGNTPAPPTAVIRRTGVQFRFISA